MRLLLVSGPWGSGTSVVTKLLTALGAFSPEPHQITNDPRTGDSFESVPFVTLLDRFVDPVKILTTSTVGLVDALGAFGREIAAGRHGAYDGAAPVVLKHPMAAAVIPELCEAFDTRLIFVARPLEDLIATRGRRGWAAGSPESAALIYSRMVNAIVQTTTPFVIVRFNEMVADPRATASFLAAFCGLDAARIDTAAALVRRR